MTLNFTVPHGFERRAFRVFSILAAIVIGMFNAAAALPFNSFPVFILTMLTVMAGSVALSYIFTNKIW